MRPAEVKRERSHVLLILYALIGMECLAALLTSPGLCVRHIKVSGLGDLPPEEEARVARAVGVLAHRNWLLAPVGAVDQTLRRLPCVEDASVHRAFPDAISIRIRTRQSEMIAQIGTDRYEIDPKQVPIRMARPTMTALPLIVLPGATAVQPGVQIDDEALRAAVQIERKVAGDASIQIGKIEVDQSHNLCLNMHDGLSILLGQPNEISEKMTLVRRIYSRRPDIARSMAEINLACPSAPSCRPRTTTTAASTGAREEPDRFD